MTLPIYVPISTGQEVAFYLEVTETESWSVLLRVQPTGAIAETNPCEF